jgi:hypothetical protein
LTDAGHGRASDAADAGRTVGRTGDAARDHTSDAADAGAADAAHDRASDAADAGAADCCTPDAGPTALHILFIGDSYTYVNDLPGMLTKIAATAGTPPTITTGEVVQGGATLQDQWEGGVAPATIQERGWTHVVLQGQSVEPLFGPDAGSTFFQYAQQFGDLIVDAGAQPTLFVTWARAAGDPTYGPLPAMFAYPVQMQDELTQAYAQVAQLWPDSILACVGEAFQRAITQYPAIDLQQSDHSHPTVAGTYLAACTFYVALTGKPVPAQSEVPAGLSAGDAENLRAVAQVGTDCADVQLEGAVAATFGVDTDGGKPFDFGTAGVPVTSQFELTNSGTLTVGISDGMSLAPPFVWTEGGAYPGGSGAGFCGSSLAPGASCTISVTYTAATSAAGRLTLDLASDYYPTLTRALAGTATERALLSVSDGPGFFACTDGCGPSIVGANSGTTAPLDLFVLNRGGSPVTAIGEGTPLSPPFTWAGGAFPGGAGSITIGYPGVSYPYCSAAALGVGEQCVVTVDFSPPTVGTYTGAASIAYSDATGPISPDANRNLEGDCRDLPP